MDTDAPESKDDASIHITWPQLPQRSMWQPNLTNAPASTSTTPPPQPTIDLASNYNPQPRDDAPEQQTPHYEYLDHTADVQLHAWGHDAPSAHAAAAVGLHAYMVDDAQSLGADLGVDVHATAHDEHSLLFAILDEFLFLFHTESFVATRVQTLTFDNDGPKWRARFRAWGAIFDPTLHKQGTEVKAITYSNMQVVHQGHDGNAHIYVIVDI